MKRTGPVHDPKFNAKPTKFSLLLQSLIAAGLIVYDRARETLSFHRADFAMMSASIESFKRQMNLYGYRMISPSAAACVTYIHRTHAGRPPLFPSYFPPLYSSEPFVQIPTTPSVFEPLDEETLRLF